MTIISLTGNIGSDIRDKCINHTPRMRVVLDQLLIKYNERVELDKRCYNCNDERDEKCSRYIMWRKFEFCGEYCQYDYEVHVRKSGRYYSRRR